MILTLQPFSPEHQAFLFALYADTRRDELSVFGWPPAQQEAFLRMQFNAQQQWYETAYGGAEHQLVLAGERPIGRTLVLHEPSADRLIDIALLAEFRGHGIGAQLLSELIKKSNARGLPLRLQVLKTNRARSLYRRLGFIETGEDDMYYQMERAARDHD